MSVGVSGEVTARNVGLLASWLIDHPMTDSPTSPLNDGVESVPHSSVAADIESVMQSTRAPLARDRSALHHTAKC